MLNPDTGLQVLSTLGRGMETYVLKVEEETSRCTTRCDISVGSKHFLCNVENSTSVNKMKEGSKTCKK